MGNSPDLVHYDWVFLWTNTLPEEVDYFPYIKTSMSYYIKQTFQYSQTMTITKCYVEFEKPYSRKELGYAFGGLQTGLPLQLKVRRVKSIPSYFTDLALEYGVRRDHKSSSSDISLPQTKHTEPLPTLNVVNP